MHWETLFSDKRFSEPSAPSSFDGRNHFENDYSRIISSSFIRRLQDKTQVFPLHQSDFIRTRLTHSLEVSAIANSMGKSVESELIKVKKMPEGLRGLLPSLLTTSGLLHDLGNPPYGHFGETAIQKYFTEYFSSNYKGNLSDIEKADFIHFDGNVQTFRILRKLSFLGTPFSYNLTFPTLATIVKYPCDASNGNKKNSDIRTKKFGYFQTEKADYETISSYLGLEGCRHPATFLLEAADDIAYSAADIEDGVKLSCLNYETVKRVFKKIANKGSQEEKDIYDRLLFFKGEADKMPPAVGKGFLVSKFRIETQVFMIKHVITQFLNVHDGIMSGNYQKELLMDCPATRIREGFKELSRTVFLDSAVLQAELAGYEIIFGLLSRLVEASHSKEFNMNGKGREARYYNLISSNLRYIYENYPPDASEEYAKLQLIVDFVSGMTDNYALNYYKSLTGMNY